MPSKFAKERLCCPLTFARENSLELKMGHTCSNAVEIAMRSHRFVEERTPIMDSFEIRMEGLDVVVARNHILPLVK
jgi:hypothetical protein